MSEQRTTGDARQDQTTELPAAGETAAMPAAAQPAAQQPAFPPQPTGPGPVPGFPIAAEPPEHPQAMTVLVLGIISLAGVWITAPIAWYLGNQALKEIDAQPGRYGKREMVNIGRILGIVGTIVMIVMTVFLIFFFLLYFGLIAAVVTTS